MQMVTMLFIQKVILITQLMKEHYVVKEQQFDKFIQRKNGLQHRFIVLLEVISGKKLIGNLLFDKVAKNIKETRDRTLIHQENGLTVNRTDNIAYLGGAALDNEECHLIS